MGLNSDCGHRRRVAEKLHRFRLLSQALAKARSMSILSVTRFLLGLALMIVAPAAVEAACCALPAGNCSGVATEAACLGAGGSFSADRLALACVHPASPTRTATSTHADANPHSDSARARRRTRTATRTATRTRTAPATHVATPTPVPPSSRTATRTRTGLRTRRRPHAHGDGTRTPTRTRLAPEPPLRPHTGATPTATDADPDAYRHRDAHPTSPTRRDCRRAHQRDYADQHPSPIGGVVVHPDSTARASRRG
jgi:hypothetical protein